MDQLDGRPAVLGRAAAVNLRSIVWLGLVGVLLLGAAACGTSGIPRLGASGVTTVAAGSSASTSPTTLPSSSPKLLHPASTCPVAAAAVTAVVGLRMYEEAAVPLGSCSFDSTAGGRGLEPTEVRVNILTGKNDLASLYGFFEGQAAAGLASCQPFHVVRRPDLGPGGFETVCGATATLGPSSVDDYLPTASGQLTLTVNRGLAVGDHSLATCEAETEAMLRLIRNAW